MSKLVVMNGVCEITLTSWEEFPAQVSSRDGDKYDNPPAVIYRGQRDATWLLRSSIDRLEEQFPKRKNLGGNPPFFNRPPLTTDQQLATFRRAIRGRNEYAIYMTQLKSDEDYWCLGQHFGLNTPLLDWTRSPFVGLFFAFEQPKSPCDSDYRAVFALSSAVVPGGKATSNKRQIVSPVEGFNNRLVAQAGIHLWVPRHSHVAEHVEARFKNESAVRYLTKFRIPHDDRERCLTTLDRMNINHMTLFPDLSGAARHVNFLWQPGLESSIQYF